MGGTESCMGVCGMELGQRALWVGQRRGGGACPGSCVGWCVGGRVGKRGGKGLVSRPLRGVADRSQGQGGRY